MLLDHLIKFKRGINLLKNFSYLSSVHLMNALSLLITYPYLISTLGSEKMGLVVYAQTIIGYLVVVVNFGFNISAVKEISQNKENKEHIAQISSSVFFIKILLFIISVCLLFLLSALNSFVQKEFILFSMTMYLCLNEILFPVWYFQGIEKMKGMAALVFISKSIFIFSIFLFVKSQTDYLLVPIFNGIGVIVSGLICFYWIVKKDQIKLQIPKSVDLIGHFNKAVPFFFSNASAQIYVNANKVFVGSILGMSSVALYDLAEKVVVMAKLPSVVLNQVLFPKISSVRKSQYVYRLFSLAFFFSLLIFLSIFIFSNTIVEILGNGKMELSIPVLRLMAVSIPLIAMSSFISLQIFVPFGLEKYYSRIILFSLIFYFLIFGTFYFMGLHSLMNLTMISVLVEIFTLLLAGLYFFRNRRIIESY